MFLRGPAVCHPQHGGSIGGLAAVWGIVRGHKQFGTSVSERSLLVRYLCSEVPGSTLSEAISTDFQ